MVRGVLDRQDKEIGVSDTSQGPGWWQASDGKWYPPEQAPGYQPAGAPQGGMPADTSIGTTLTYAWNKFIQNIGEWVVLWLIMLAIVFGGAIITGIVVAGAGVGGFSFRFNFLGIGFGLIFGALQGVMLVVVAKGAVMAVNGQKVDVGAAFKLTGNNIIAGVIFGVINGLLSSFCSIFGIVAFLFFGFLPILSALDDKGADGVSESINLSTSRSNETMLYWLVGWLITGLVCFLGAPIAMIGGTYMVKRYRGEPVAP